MSIFNLGQFCDTVKHLIISMRTRHYPQLDEAIHAYLRVWVLSAPDIKKHANHRNTQEISLEIGNSRQYLNQSR